MIQLLTILFLLSSVITAHAQLIPDGEFNWFYKIGVNCKYYVSAEQDPILNTYSHDE